MRTPAYDELREPGGAPRDHWRLLDQALLGADGATLARTRERVRRLRRHQGTTPAAPAGPDRMGALDPIPHVVSAADWARLDAGLRQRALLLDRLLADLYGPRRTLAEGLLPTPVVYAHHGFLRGCVGIEPPRWLVTAAFDLVRAPSGEFLIRADRVSTPQGLGDMLSARRVLAQLHPELYRRLRVARVESFYDTLRSTLAGLAAGGTANPRTLILTPGPGSEGFPEHAYLARNLGLTLVVGSDLTVRDGRVFLMSVAGLEPADVVLRLVEDPLCDPLELRADSVLGTPGLVAAARRGTVGLANALGAGLAENPALTPFLPRLCRALLDQDLILESVPSFWCGERTGRSHVLARLETMTLRSLASGETLTGRQLDPTRRAELAGRIEARPHLWVGTEEVEGSTVPLVDGERLVPGRLGLRCFAVADGDGYQALPGGLARAVRDGPGEGAGEVAVRKDAWVLAEDRHRLTSPILALAQIDLGASLPSRNAEALYWIGRHAEAAETVIRLVQTIGSELGETPELAAEAGGAWVAAFVACLGWTAENPKTASDPGTVPAGAPVGGGGDGPGDALGRVLVDETLPRSLVSSLSELLAASLSARELLSTQTCQVLVALEDELAALRSAAGPAEAEEMAAGTLTQLMALVGLAAESMVRDPGWLFTDIGRRLERARLLVRVLGETLGRDVDAEIRGLLYETLLEACESLMAFRRRYRSDIEVAALVQFLVADAGNPRSLRYQLEQLRWDLGRLPGGRAEGALAPVGQALEQVLEADWASLLGVEAGRRTELVAWLAAMAGHLERAGETVRLTYFAHVPVHAVAVASTRP